MRKCHNKTTSLHVRQTTYIIIILIFLYLEKHQIPARNITWVYSHSLCKLGTVWLRGTVTNQQECTKCISSSHVQKMWMSSRLSKDWLTYSSLYCGKGETESTRIGRISERCLMWETKHNGIWEQHSCRINIPATVNKQTNVFSPLQWAWSRPRQ